MRFRVDRENNVGYLELADKPIEETIELGQNTLIDVDANDDIVGIEFLDLKHMRIPAQVPVEDE